jgi:pimeloyl-ACP methyl ester carboxylesterase
LNDRLLTTDDLTLCVETFGDPAHPTIVLVGGASSSMDWWDPDLCDRLAAGGRQVVRFDHRDTGRSTSYPPGAPGYGQRDLAQDIIRVIDGLGVGPAHLVGMSLGGGLAQYVAVTWPGHVSSLTLISTTPGGPGVQSDDLPSMTPDLADYFECPPPDPDWARTEEVVESIVYSDRVFSGPDQFDEDQSRALATSAVARTNNLAACMANHWIAEPLPQIRHLLGSIDVPTLVVHGTADPLFPRAHGQAMAGAIPGAELLELVGVGHQVPPRAVWDTFVPAVLRLTSAS